MLKTVLIAATLLASAAPSLALAAADDAGKFSNKGVDYSYTTEDKGGDKVVRGTAYAGKVPFELHIHKKTVTGTFNNKPVEFELNDVQKLGINTAN
ncbi:hypothetical protein [Novosphingobium sp.]|uniref:hypothetical protein n=1 Tax=Novosphingobium sp. TaxID=1874826 RepID=UPI003D0FCE43